MKKEGNIRKMRAELGDVVHYFLKIGNSEIFLNELIGKKVSLQSTGVINCIRCGKITRTSFARGYCYSCFVSAPETEECVLRPELCRAHEGIARDMEFAKDHCLIDHFVYLAMTPVIKVGVTRYTQIPVRWIDQGADRAIILAKVPNRFLAGTIEVALKDIFPDKTNWRLMLTGAGNDGNELVEKKGMAEDVLPFDLRSYIYPGDEVTSIRYPVPDYPHKIRSMDLEKTGKIEGILTGIKGQYLIFNNSEVINLRKYGGYELVLEF